MSVCNVHTSLWGNCHVKYTLKFSVHTQPAQPTLSWHCKMLLPSFYPAPHNLLSKHSEVAARIVGGTIVPLENREVSASGH